MIAFQPDAFQNDAFDSEAPGEITGEIAVTLDDFTSAIEGDAEAPVFTGTFTVTLEDASAELLGEVTVPAFEGTISATLDDFVGSFVAPSAQQEEHYSGGFLTAEDRRVNKIREEDVEIMDFIMAFLEAA